MELTRIKNILREKLPLTNIKYEEQMNLHTSFKVGGIADIFIIANTINEIKDVLKISRENNIPLKVIGNGSNLLVKDKGFRGIILKINLQEISITQNEESENECLVKVQAGIPLGKLAQILCNNEIGGFEFASGIPGTIGGAIKMNAGAYGYEFKDIIQNVTYLNSENEIIKVQNNECNFSYRHSFFSENNSIILECTLKLYKEKKENIKQKLEENLQKRKEKQPIEYPSAGSTFKRGEDYITAKLIDECGLKGYTIGGAQISEKHAGFVINKNNATAEEIINLIEYTKEIVYQKTGKKIELEIEIIGE